MLDFSFSIQRHISGGGLARLRHSVKDFFGSEGAKFQAKVTTIATLKAKVVEKSQGVFQSKSIQRFDEVQDSVSGIMTSVQDIKDFQSTSEEFYKAQRKQQDEILHVLSEVKASTKAKSRWDWAVQDYEAKQELLNPLKGTVKILADRLDQKLIGSCDWILEMEEFQGWLNADNSQLLCVTGRDGVGKSMLLSAVWESLDGATEEEQCAIIFVPCDMIVPGTTGDDSPQALNRIANTLISQLYEYARMDEDQVALLEDCNSVFKNPKERLGAQGKDDQKEKASGKTARLRGKKKDDRLPDLAEGLTSLACIMKKKVFILLDGVDRMSEEDQIELYSQLKDIDNDEDEDWEILTLLSFRSGTKLFGQILDDSEQVMNIEIEKHNRGDIELLLNTELSQIIGWTESQRKEAKDKIVEKAGPIFKYVVQVALPFIKEPFSGSLSKRLESLPAGIGETYSQALQAMSNNYVDLLCTALSFSLFRVDEYPSVKEVRKLFPQVNSAV